MDLNLKGKIVLVTGGTKGIGLETARVFLREGAKVAIVSRSQSNVDKALRALEGSGAVLWGKAADLSNAGAAARLAADVELEVGPIDILVNSAGSAKRTAVDDLGPDAWQAGLCAKFFSYVYIQDEVLKRMRARAEAAGTLPGGVHERQHGAVVNVVGMGGKAPTETHLPGSAANAALLISTMGLAQFYGRYGIRINSVNPGVTLTDRMEETLRAEAQRQGIDREEAYSRGAARSPLGRYGRPEEIANLIAFVASERASYIVGASISADGGQRAIL